jgi:hypothetical protein
MTSTFEETEVVESGDYDEDPTDSDFAPQPRRKLGKLSILLIAAVIAGAGFLGGVAIGKNHTSTSTASGLGGAARAGGFPGLTGEGGAGFGGQAAGGAGTGTTAGTAAGTAAATPVAIGTVVSLTGQTLLVKNLGGTQVTVHLSATTTVTKTVAGTDLSAGQTVSVFGTTGTDASVTATAITITS